MNEWTAFLLDPTPIPDVLIKITLVLLIGWALHFFLRGRNPRWRVLLWRSVVVGVIAIPLLVLIAPEFEIPVTVSERPASVVSQVIVGQAMPVGANSIPAIGKTEKPFQPVQHNPPPIQSMSLQPIDPPVPMPATTREIQPISITSFFKSHWREILISPWVSIFLILALRFLLANLRIHRLVRSSNESSEGILRVAQKVAADLGIKEVIGIRVSDKTNVPFLAGLRKPMILLPLSTATPEYRAELPAILAHEMSHAQSRDLWWSWLIHVIQTVLWFPSTTFAFFLIWKRASPGPLRFT